MTFTNVSTVLVQGVTVPDTPDTVCTQVKEKTPREKHDS